MNNNKEDHSLTEVREWKEQCRQEDEGLSLEEYREKLRSLAEPVKSEFFVKQKKPVIF